VQSKPSAGQAQQQAATGTRSIFKERWLPLAAWIVALALLGLAGVLGWQTFKGHAAGITSSELANPVSSNPQATLPKDPTSEDASSIGDAGLSKSAEPQDGQPLSVISRRSELRTIIPNRPSEDVRPYTVEKGDSVFEIAAHFNLKPESILWANYDQLNDNPDMISLGMELNIPPVDGVLYNWKAGDTLDGVAGQFKVSPEDILNWPGNNIDLADRTIEPGSLVMVPGGKREFRQWIIPTIPRGRAGVSQSVYGGGACEGGYDGAYGSGAFIWPAGNHGLSGNDYWDGHLGIDIAAGEGAPLYAADSGVVVFAGWATGGYGNMVMIDHGNGYQTLYGHMSSVKVGCGQSVSQGTIIGFAGSTGNSTGAHLHFEVRYQGGFVNPWYVLPAP
jgi:murein DD-endopeptidase MepM/ murein hydrolase activator NlpD